MVAVVQNKNPEVIRALLRAGADMNARDKRGNPALMEASNNKNLEGIRILKEAGAKA